MDEQEKKKNTKLGCLMLIIIFVAIGVLVWSCVPDFDEEPDLKTGAIVASRMFVEQHLKAPGTAKFPLDENVLDLGDGRWRVEASVDAQNSFGALIRTKYVCFLKRVGDDWLLESLDFKE